MCISHSVMEGQRHNNPLTCVAFVYNDPKGMELLTHAIVKAAKALGGSFKLVTLVPKNCNGDDSTAQGNIKECGHANKSKAQMVTRSTNLG